MRDSVLETLGATTIISAIRTHADASPTHVACIFQPYGPESAQQLTYAQLVQEVDARAALLAEKGMRGNRAALLYPTGLDFVINFLACLACGAVAVPLNLSTNQKYLARTQSILKNAEVTALLTTSDTINSVGKDVLPERFTSSGNQVLTEVDLAQTELNETNIQGNDVAFIQYTSGSTSVPKGVIVSHANIIANQKAIQHACGHTKPKVIGGWLPQFHDMGLIGHMLHPLFIGGTYVFMPPMNFIQKPLRWLQLIDQYQIHSSAAPNFGYQYCVQKIKERDIEGKLDLSNWRVALNGSEPIRASTMKQFTEKFSSCGFDGKAVFPCYGMAETTLLVSGGPNQKGLQYDMLNRNALEEGIAKEELRTDEHLSSSIVNCGEISQQFDIAIVHPKNCQRCGQGEIGEIWVSGPSVALGYLNNPKATQETFRAQITGEPARYYLRTGDLGYLSTSGLHVTGRIKELIIVRGKNLYPYDIERTCNDYEYAAGNNGASVFSVETEKGGELAGIVEIKKAALKQQCHQTMKRQLRAMIGDEHGIALDHLELVAPGVIPKTSSGKVKRTQCSHLIQKQYG